MYGTTEESNMYRIDHTLSTEQNLVKLASANALYPFAAGDFELTDLEPISPTAGNEYSNTRAKLVGLPEGRLEGEQTVEYTRLTLPGSRPTAGDKLVSGNGDTHASIHARILARHRLVADEVVFTDPPRIPVGGETLAYRLNPKPDSQIYLPGELVIQVRNREAFDTADSSYFFGSPVGEYNGQPVYLLGSTAVGSYSANMLTKREVFANLLNLKRLKDDGEFTQDNLDLGLPQAGTIEGQSGNTLIQFSPGDGSPVNSGGYFLYTRQAVPLTITLNPGDADYDYYAGMKNELLYPAFMQKNKYPRDEFAFIRVLSTTAARTLEFTQVTPTFTVVTNAAVHKLILNN